MNISIYYFGKKNDLKSLQDEYIKRLSAFCHISIFQLKPSSLKEKNSVEEVMKEEAIELLKRWPDGYVIVLDREGKELSTKSFAEKLASLNDGGKNVSFIIGGAYGLDKSILEMADLNISLSKMTFPHELSRIILLEQIYRAFTIIKGKKYHY